MENKIPTAEEFFNKRSKELGFENWTNVIVNQEWEIIELLPIEFTKFHVEEALKQSYQKAELKEQAKDDEQICYMENYMVNSYVLDKDSILNAYPLENIK